MKPSAIELHIDELVLDGFAHADRHSIAYAFERELARLLSEHGLDASHVARFDGADVDAGAFALAPRGGTRGAGEHIARAVHGGLTR